MLQIYYIFVFFSVDPLRTRRNSIKEPNDVRAESDSQMRRKQSKQATQRSKCIDLFLTFSWNKKKKLVKFFILTLIYSIA